MPLKKVKFLEVHPATLERRMLVDLADFAPSSNGSETGSGSEEEETTPPTTAVADQIAEARTSIEELAWFMA